ncbi:right-handed parallel beta-helix repeat-containing protein [Caminibacter pacificus]
MIKKLLLVFIVSISLYAGKCFSILTQTGLFTPVYPFNFKQNLNYVESQCDLFDERIVWENNLSYVGCYKNFEDANYTLHHLKFNFLTPKIVEHNATLKDQYVIFPNSSTVKPKNLNYILNKYKPENIVNKFPKKIYGNGIDYLKLSKINFLPRVNLYEFYKFYRKNNFSTKVLVLYNGVYSIDYLYKKINNPSILKKIDEKTYVLKRPLYISPTASLVVDNKILLLETNPKPIFIMYHGNLYAKNSKFIAWDIKYNKFSKRRNLKTNQILLAGVQKPRPYFIGLAGSKTYFLNNLFKGLGFYSISATNGVSQIYFPRDFVTNEFNLYTYLNSKGRPLGVYIGNTFTQNMIGYYSTDSNRNILIGNLMYENVIDNISIANNSKNILIARNITANAKLSHGIVFSTGVKNSTIAQNITIGNNNSGIMIYNLSNHNFVFDNLSALNGKMGLSLQESDDSLVLNNKIIGNQVDGVLIRNALKVTLKDNIISYNEKNGIEVLTKNIKLFTVFASPFGYHRATSAQLFENEITNNMLYAITVKNNAALKLKGNKVINKYYSPYGAELNIFTADIQKQNGRFTLYGIGNPFLILKGFSGRMSMKTAKQAKKIFIDASCSNDFVSSMLAKLYYNKYKNPLLSKRVLIRGISLIHPDDMDAFGYYKFIYAKSKNDYIEGLSYIAQSVIFGNINAANEILQLKYFIPVNRKDINNAFKLALDRLKHYKLISTNENSKCSLTNKQKSIIETAWKTFTFNVENSNVKDYFHYCKLISKNYTIFTPDVIAKIKYAIKRKNELKFYNYRKHRHLAKKLLENAPAGCYKAYARIERLNNTLKQYYQTEKPRILKTIDPYIEDYLKMINEYRLNKISKRKIYELMQEN